MGEPVKIVDLARDMIRLSGLELGKDIDIEFVGQRPGEKLFEELNCDGERHRPTSHTKIMIAEGGRAELAELQGALERLRRIINGNASPIIAMLKNIVPQYAIPQPAFVPRPGAGKVRAASDLVPIPSVPSLPFRDVISIGDAPGRAAKDRRKVA
jgi:hypothetical protein